MAFTVATAFEQFCKNLRFSDGDLNKIGSRYHSITRLSKRYWQEQKEQAEKSQKSTNPFSWKYSFHPDKSGQHFDALFSHCGIWYLMQKLGIPEITPAMCRYDYGMTKYSDAIFTRNGTLAGGAELCDCHYDKKQK